MTSTLPRVLLAAAALSICSAQAQTPRIDHLEPPFWWTGMQDKSVQLMVHDASIGKLAPSLSYPGVRIAKVTRVANPNYLFIDLQLLAAARPGKFDIRFGSGADALRHGYQLLARGKGSAARQGFSSKDVIYQVMPDCFANGDPANDSVAGMADKADRAGDGARHGGDIQGMIGHLDYIAGMGFTQLWPTPLVENDMPSYSYHGYAATDHYRIDPRYGSNEDFRHLSQEARKRGTGTGIPQDVVLSHIGSGHWWMKDMPFPDWTKHRGAFVPTRHHRVSAQDPYGAIDDRENFTTGWFTSAMPDLNQTNPLVANYFIQNNIWWIEYAGLSDLRIDTYDYSDGAFLTQYTRRLMAEYPHLNMVGEEWHKSPAVVSRWQKGKRNFDGYVSSLPSLIDVPMSEVMRAALASKAPEAGFTDVHETLSLDYLYPNPGQLVLFEGNHDMARMFSVVGQDIDLYTMNLAWLLTMPRIPQLYYGTEIQMTSSTTARDDASYRRDFSGGWTGGKVDAFTGTGLTAQQRDAQALVRRLVTWRKTQPVIHSGKMMHYGAENGTYVYFRYDGKKKVIVALHKNTAPAVLPVGRFSEMLTGVRSGVDVISGETFALDAALTLPARATVILELQ
ncbi:glycoside hydrolase family 13 protein [Massilia sp. TSP1-1-2]|uniref:glycoside hydrolase family 13 protein n=1 Tax=unclassified Massilia TaxID=2609279 RepID=UPI003CF05130